MARNIPSVQWETFSFRISHHMKYHQTKLLFQTPPDVQRDTSSPRSQNADRPVSAVPAPAATPPPPWSNYAADILKEVKREAQREGLSSISLPCHELLLARYLSRCLGPPPSPLASISDLLEVLSHTRMHGASWKWTALRTNSVGMHLDGGEGYTTGDRTPERWQQQLNAPPADTNIRNSNKKRKKMNTFSVWRSLFWAMGEYVKDNFNEVHTK